MNNVIDFINTHRDRYVDELKSYLAIPSISALPQHKEDVRRCAEWTADEMRRIGLQNVKLIETPGFPVVPSSCRTSRSRSSALWRWRNGGGALAVLSSSSLSARSR